MTIVDHRPDDAMLLYQPDASAGETRLVEGRKVRVFVDKCEACRVPSPRSSVWDKNQWVPLEGGGLCPRCRWLPAAEPLGFPEYAEAPEETLADRLFPLGVRVRSQTAFEVAGQAGVDSRIARHARGDFGLFGKLSATNDDDASWCPLAFERATQNAVAIKAGSGFIESRYQVDPSESVHASQWTPTLARTGRNGGDLRILTKLEPGRPPGTLIWSTHDTDPQF